MQEQEKQTAKGRDLYEWVQSLVGSVLVVVAIFTFVIRMMGVDGHSMLNTLQHGDRLLVVNSMLYHDYKYGDIVILRKNGVFDDDPIVKRVIAVEGQTVDIDFAEGIVYVDGEALEEDYIREPTYTAEGTEFPLTVPEGSIFVMGDNRNGSSDSRDYRLGTVDTRYVIGKAAFLIFPGPDYETEKRDFKRIGVIWSCMNIQWYPGHMTKTRRMIAEQIKNVDAVCEILVARIPVSSRNPDVDELTAGKPRMVVLNRVDQADPEGTKRWAEHFRAKGYAVLESDAKSGVGTAKFAGAVRELLADKLRAYAEKGMTGRVVRVMWVSPM